MYHGEQTVGTSTVQLNIGTASAAFGVLVKADKDNTGIVYIGDYSVTVTGGAYPGFPLSAGEAVLVEIDNIDKVYAIADTAVQEVHWIAT